MLQNNDILFVDINEELTTGDTNVASHDNSNNSVRLKVNFEKMNLSESEEDGLNLADLERNCAKRSASNLNRDAKLKYQTNIIQKKHAISHLENPIKPNNNKHHLKSFNALNSTNNTNNNGRTDIDRGYGSFNNSGAGFRRMQTHQIQEGEEEILNINKEICKVNS